MGSVDVVVRDSSDVLCACVACSGSWKSGGSICCVSEVGTFVVEDCLEGMLSIMSKERLGNICS